MGNDSKGKILDDWNVLKHEQEIPYRLLVFDTFDDLYRYLKGQSRRQGRSTRKDRLNELEGVNIIPSSSQKKEVLLSKQKKSEKLLRADIDRFLRRIKALKS